MFKAIQKSKAKKGFTLVELIVVISIIAILLLILVPSLLSFLNRARETRLDANAKSAYNACIALYTDEVSKGNSPAIADLPASCISAGVLDSNWSGKVTCTATSGNTGISFVTFTDGDKSAKWPK